jgi:predicted Zn-dependent protease
MLAGTPADAVPVFQAGLRRYPQSIPLRIGIGTAQFLVGHSSEAVHTLLDAADSDPADPRPYPFLAAASGLSADEHDRVRESFKRFAIREPGNATANYLYAVVLSRDTANADNSAIEALLKRAIRLDPSLAKAHLKLADLYAQRNDDADAIPEYHAAIRLAPEMSEAHYRLAKASKRIGHADESVREMQIFQQQKAKPSSDDGIDIAQFISVMDAPSQHAGAELQCPARQPD